MASNKSLRYRAVCPHCNKAFDTRERVEFNNILHGYLVCPDCALLMRKYKTLDDFIEHECK